MNEAVAVATDGLLTTADLAVRPDFTLGLAIVSPSTRTLAGPGGAADVEPRVMQVLVVLAEAAGQVVTRGTLFNRCWGGVYVGDDSLNRAVAAVRKLGAEIAGGSFEVETIPRTGYRLAGQVSPSIGGEAGAQSRRLSRRMLVGGGIAAVAAAGAAGIWWTSTVPDPRFVALMARGDQAFRNGSAFEESSVAGNGTSGTNMIRLYEEAVAIQPGSARAWGLLAYFSSEAADEALSAASAHLIARSQTAIQRALDIDPNEPNARVAMYLLQGYMLDWAARDRQLRGILATDPHNIPAMGELMPLLQAAGYTRESWMWNERILRASPFARGFLVVRSMKLWILGRSGEADQVIDRVRGLWPTYDFGFLVRLMLFTLTGRPRAAMAMIEAAPNLVPAPDFWRASAEALDTRSPQAIGAARQACFDIAEKQPWLTNMAVMIICALGMTDAAFELTNGYLLWRGKAISSNQAESRDVDDYSRRMTQWLFTPPAAVMRADSRFQQLSDAFGLGAFWRARHVRPDYQVYG